MKKILIAVAILLYSLSAISQESNVVKPDERLYQCWSKEYVDDLVKTNPELIGYYNYYLDNSYFTSSLKQQKAVEGIDIHTVLVKEGEGAGKEKFSETKFDKKKFNPLKYNFVINTQSHTTYIFKEAGIAIVFYPIEKIAKDFKNSNNQ